MTSRKKMDEKDLVSLLRSKLDSSIQESSGIEADQTRALEAYNGDGYGNEIEGRSQFVTRDVMEQIEWTMPQLMRVFGSGKKFVTFTPRGAHDEQQVELESDAVNQEFTRAGGWLVLHDWFKSALLNKVAYVKAYYETDTIVETETHQGLNEFALAQLVNPDEVEVTEQEEQLVQQPVIDPMTQQPVLDELGQPYLTEETLYSVKIKRTRKFKRLHVDALPPEEMRVGKSTHSISLDSGDFTAHETEKPLSDLIEMGYKEQDILEAAHEKDESSLDYSRSDHSDEEEENDHYMQPISYAECYARVDWDNDGVAELRRIILIGNKIFDNDEWDENPFEALCPVLMPHTHVGNSLVDLVEDIQKGKSDLFRQVIDNLRLTNNPEKEVVSADIIDPNELYESMPGGVKRVRKMGAIREITVPFTAGHSVPILKLFDEMKEARTGISRHTMGLDADALAQSTKGAFFGAMQQANSRVEMIARVFAETGVKNLFRKIHRLMIDNQEEVIRFKRNGQWIEVHPSQWQRRDDLTVNVGLGTGDESQMVQMLIGIAQQQTVMLQQQIPIITPEDLYNTWSKVIELSDLREPEVYFTHPQQVMQMQAQQQQAAQQAAAQAAANDPNNKMIQLQDKLGQMQAALDKQKAEMADMRKAQELSLKEREQTRKEAETEHKMDMDNKEHEFDITKAEIEYTTNIVGGMNHG